ncbi:MAG: hypothetical protein R2724_35020 [Bryobacterales bacterium]
MDHGVVTTGDTSGGSGGATIEPEYGVSTTTGVEWPPACPSAPSPPRRRGQAHLRGVEITLRCDHACAH